MTPLLQGTDALLLLLLLSSEYPLRHGLELLLVSMGLPRVGDSEALLSLQQPLLLAPLLHQLLLQEQQQLLLLQAWHGIHQIFDRLSAGRIEGPSERRRQRKNSWAHPFCMHV